MIRTLLFSAATVTLLAGCMSGYSYRQDRGDYYYGHPTTEYRYYDSSPYYYGSYSRYYGYPYYRGYSRYPYGYYDYRYPRPPVVVRPRPDDDHHDHDDRPESNGKAPWRDIGRYQRERLERGTPVVPQRRAQSAAPARPAATPRPAPRPRSNSGSRMESIMDRARSGRMKRERQVEK